MGVTDWVSGKVGAVKDTVVEGTKDGLEWAGDKLGMDVSERELDETVEPGELVHGSPGDLREAADHLAEFAKAFESTGQALRKIATGEWSGAAGDAFREKFDAHPKRWLTAADACHDAATALHAYADTVEWARGQAAVAVRTWRAAEQRSEHARAAYEREQQAVWDYKVAGSFGAEQGPAPKDPGAFDDPGAAGRQEAQEILNEARSQRTSAAAAAKSKVVEASKGAPDAPGVGTQLLSAVGDYTKSGIVSTEHLLGGFIKGGSDTVRLINTVQPITPYNLTHPMQYLSNVSGLTAGLVKSTNHPVDLVKGLAGSGWSKDPVEATGTFLFDAATDVATGGAATGASAARRGLTAVARDGAEEATEAAVRGAGRHAAEDFAGGAGRHASEDLAGGAGESAAKHGGNASGGASELPEGWTVDRAPENPAVADGANSPFDDAGKADDVLPHTPADDHAGGSAEVPEHSPSESPAPDAPDDALGDPDGHGGGQDGPAPDAPDRGDWDKSDNGAGEGQGPGGDLDRSPQDTPDQPSDGSPEQSPGAPPDETPDGDTSAARGDEHEALTGARDFDADSAVRYGNSELGDTVRSLPAGERDALHAYTSHRFGDINGLLRGDGGLASPQVEGWIDNIDSAMSKSTLPEDLVVHRATDLDHWLKEFDVKDPQALTGKTLTDDGYLSTSLGPTRFTHTESVLHLRAPEGTHGMWVDEISQNRGERELLLDRGQKFQVSEVANVDGKYHIYGEIVAK
ncbi:putative T7SS-secreted protein [Streptomyces sp. BH106]|uniref:putative T7SS-secreted protein n=1 Tax=Streptomyces sp. BH106 TaxID=3410409 RepID=UPI003CF16B5D